MKRHIYIWIIVLQTLFAQSNNDLFTSANQLYKINDYQSAIRNYEQILSSSEHEDIYYNLGNAYFRNPNGDEYGGISLRQELKDVTVLIYGMRRR